MFKKVILLLLAFIITLSVVGCSTPKPPEGIDEEVWEDSLEMIEILNTIYEEERLLKRKDEIKTYDEYRKFYENNKTLTEQETELVNSILYFKSYWEIYLRYKENKSISEKYTREEYDKAMEYYNKIKEFIK